MSFAFLYGLRLEGFILEDNFSLLITDSLQPPLPPIL